MAEDIEGWIVSLGNFRGIGYKDFLVSPHFKGTNSSLGMQYCGFSCYGNEDPAIAKNQDYWKEIEQIPTINLLEHPQLGPMTLYVWKMPCADPAMELDEFGRASPSYYGVLIRGHRFVRLDEKQRQSILAKTQPVYEDIWNKCKEAYSLGNAPPPEIVPEKILPTVRLINTPKESGLPILPGYRLKGKSEFPALQPDDIKQIIDNPVMPQQLGG